jgi:hypothetical protein
MLNLQVLSVTKMRIDILKKLKKLPKRAGYLFLALLIALTGLIWWHPSRAHAQTDTFTTSGTWNVPAGVSSAVFEAWGGGGGGAGTSSSIGGSGGSGGDYAKISKSSLSTGTAYTVTVGSAGVGTTTGCGGIGGDSFVQTASADVVRAVGETGGVNAGNNCAPPLFGDVGTTIHVGGAGSVGVSGASGAGGGGAGSGGTGGNASGTTPGTGTATNGGSGGAGITSRGTGNIGNNYGGGGGGGFWTSGPARSGGDGAQGLVTVTYTAANTPPNLPTIISPANGAVVASTVSFQVSATDPNNDSLKYIVTIYADALCSSALVETGDQTVSGTGWDNGTTAYASGATATYTPQSALTSGSAYCFDVAAIDPTGSNTQSIHNSITFTINSSPLAPSLITPSSGSTGISTTPSFTLRTTDLDGDYLDYRIYLYQSDCSTPVGSSPFAQTGSQTGWSGQDANTGAAYVGSSTLAGSTIATYTYQGALANNTQYCWKADAIDPGGSNTYSSASATQLFTTLATPPAVTIGGGVNINGGSTIQ